MLAYFYQIENPFYDLLGLNEQIYMKNLLIEAIVQSNEFILLKFFSVFDNYMQLVLNIDLQNRQDSILYILFENMFAKDQINECNKTK